MYEHSILSPTNLFVNLAEADVTVTAAQSKMFSRQWLDIRNCNNRNDDPVTLTHSLTHSNQNSHEKSTFFSYSSASTPDSNIKRRPPPKRANAVIATAKAEGRLKDLLATNEDDEEVEDVADVSAATDETKTADGDVDADDADEKPEENGKGEKSTEDGDEKDDDETADGDDTKKANHVKKSSTDRRSSPRTYIRLKCPHCRINILKFQVGKLICKLKTLITLSFSLPSP